MDIRKLKTILDLFENSSLAEIEFCEGEERIRLSKGVSAPVTAVAPQQQPAPGALAPAAPPAADAATPPAEAPPESGTVVSSPMVGTFYQSPSPDKPAFVSVGSTVSQGDTLCIIEAMKLMNEIPSPVSGTVKRIIANNGDAVAFGAELFVIE